MKYKGTEVIKETKFKKNLKVINFFQNLEYLIFLGNKNIINLLLKNANLTGLKELVLSSNKINDIKILENLNFDRLEKLNLGHNKISI